MAARVNHWLGPPGERARMALAAPARPFYGSGCTLAAAIAARLALGETMPTRSTRRRPIASGLAQCVCDRARASACRGASCNDIKGEHMRGLYLVTPNWDDTDRLLAVHRAGAAGRRGIAAIPPQGRRCGAAPEQARRLLALCRRYTAAAADQRFRRAVPGAGRRRRARRRHRRLGGAGARARWAGQDRRRLLLRRPGAGARGRSSEGASYVAFGGFYPSLVKQYRSRRRPTSCSQAQARDRACRCVVIGGMTPENAAPLVARGADMVAAITSVYLADDLAAAVRHSMRCFPVRQRARSRKRIWLRGIFGI